MPKKEAHVVTAAITISCVAKYGLQNREAIAGIGISGKPKRSVTGMHR